MLQTSRRLWIGLGLAGWILAAAAPQGQESPDRLDKIEKQLGELKGLVEQLAGTVREAIARVIPPEAAKAAEKTPEDPVARIRAEGLNRSQVMTTLGYLTEVIGPRLTGSPSLKRANAWTRDQMASWGLVNAAVEPWGDFGRGWSLKRFSAQVIAPYAFPLAAFPKAWTPGFDQPLTAEVIHLEAKAEADLDKYQGKLKGAIVLVSPPRELKASFDPLAERLNDTNLLRLANAAPPTPRAAPSATGGGARPSFPSRVLAFLAEQQASLAVSASTRGDGGVVFVQGASLPADSSASQTNRLRPWSADAPAMIPQISLGAEDYNRLVRMLQHGQKVMMEVDLQTDYHTEDLSAANTVAEIPGSDLKDEIVMLGAHLDSWHGGTGATDNAAGVAVMMEAARIIKALNLQPRRTIRVALWTGEEQGLFGSTAYVSNHFGYFTNVTAAAAEDADKATNATRRLLVRQPGYDRLSAYFNFDNGTGRIRGIHMEGNEGVRPLFRQWLEPFADLGAGTLSASATFGTDHLPFDWIGLPGFQFIQDPVEYSTRTHHSTMDVYDRIQAEDLKQAATVIAALAWHTAMRDEKLPRKTPPEMLEPAAPAIASAPPAGPAGE